MAIQGGTAMQLPGRQGFVSTPYERHQPEQTLLYQLVETHCPALLDQLAQQGKSLPDHVHREFNSFLKCGRLEHGFLAKSQAFLPTSKGRIAFSASALLMCRWSSSQ